MQKHLLIHYGAVTSVQSSSYKRPFKGECIADVSPSENEFDTPVLETLGSSSRLSPTLSTLRTIPTQLLSHAYYACNTISYQLSIHIGQIN